MKKTSRILSLALALLLTLTLTVATAVAAQPESAILTLTDMLGRELSFTKPVERIVVLQPADAEILYAIGVGDLLVGRGEYVNYPAQVLELPSVQSGFETNFEQIVALEPDVVVMTMMSQREEDSKKLEDAGILTVISNAQSIQGVYEAIALMGKLTGKTEEAAALVDSMRASFDEIRQKAQGKDGGSIYFEVSPLAYGLWTAGTATFMDEIAGMLGLTNAFHDLEGWQSVSEEQVISRDPDYIVTTAMYFGEGVKPVEEVLARPNWSGLKAVKNQNVFNSDSDEITRPGPRLVNAAQALYEFVYGK